MPRSFPAALPVARAILKLLVVLTWIYAATLLAILVGLISNPAWSLTVPGFAPAHQTAALFTGVRLTALVGLAAVPLNLIVLRRLLEMIDTVRAGDPFVARNAERLQVIAWAVLGQQVLQLMVSLIARATLAEAQGLHVDAVPTSGLLAVILLFVLARVFAEGANMRDDLAGTV
ncbi:MAG: DUF2975 domain-containing protein [Sphingomonas bacterium]